MNVKHILLLNGNIGIGKTYLSNIFAKHGYSKESFAYTLKIVSYNLMKYFYQDIAPNNIYGDYKAKNKLLTRSKTYSALNASFYFEDWLNTQEIYPIDSDTKLKCKRKLFKFLDKDNITPREILQYIGTDIFRKIIHKDFNVLSLMNRLDDYNGNIVIDDYRFNNEYDLLKDKYKVFTVSIQKERHVNSSKHISENSKLSDFDYIVNLKEGELISHSHYEIIRRMI